MIIVISDKQKRLLLKADAATHRPGRLESRPLRVSQRSNALHFYHPPSDQYSATKSRSYYLYTDPRPSPASLEPSAKKYGSTQPPSRHRAISSLVTPFLAVPSKGKRTSGSIKKQDRNSVSRLNSSAASIRSLTSSVLSRKRRYAAPPTLETLPSEILSQIFSYLGQKTLHNLMFCSRRMNEEASYNLYENPTFKTTYRFAQFVTTITHDRHKALMVKSLDVSNLGKEAGEDEKPLAGWREWKFRSDPLHTIHRDDLGSSLAKGGKAGIVKTQHPPPSPFLQRYSFVRDIPIGAILHVVASCPFIRKIDLSHVPLAADYAVSSLGSLRTGYYPTAFTSLLFVSDVPKSFTWQEGDTRPLSCSVDLIETMITRNGLKEIILRGGIWVTRNVAERLVSGSRALQSIDLRECGMYRERKWTIVGSKSEVERLITEEKEAELEKEKKEKEAEARRRRLAGIF